MALKNVATVLSDGAKKHAPEILTGFGIVGFFTSIVLASKATTKANMLIEERKLDEKREELTKKEVIQTTWKCYIPAAITAGCATACVIGGTKTGLKRGAAMAAAYRITKESYDIYRDKVIETIGEKKEQEVREKRDKELVERHKFNNYEVNPIPPDTIFYYDGRYFYSTWDKVKEAVAQLGEDMLDNPGLPRVSLNDFFYLVGLANTEMGEVLGWEIGINGRPELYPPTCIEMEGGRICMVVSFRNPPKELL